MTAMSLQPFLAGGGFMFCLPGVIQSRNIIATVAGTDRVLPAGSRPAIDAPLNNISGVAADSEGNIYSSDRSNDGRIRAGGTRHRTECLRCRRPQARVGLAVGPDGTVYFSEYRAVVRTITPGGLGAYSRWDRRSVILRRWREGYLGPLEDRTRMPGAGWGGPLATPKGHLAICDDLKCIRTGYPNYGKSLHAILVFSHSALA